MKRLFAAVAIATVAAGCSGEPYDVRHYRELVAREKAREEERLAKRTPAQVQADNDVQQLLKERQVTIPRALYDERVPPYKTFQIVVTGPNGQENCKAFVGPIVSANDAAYSEAVLGDYIGSQSREVKLSDCRPIAEVPAPDPYIK